MSFARLMRDRSRWTWGLLSTLLWVGTLLTFAFFASPYAALKPIADRFSRDGNAKPFTPGFYATARPFDGLAALALLGLALFFLLRREAVIARLDRLLGWATRQAGLTARDARDFFRNLRAISLARGELLLILAITLIGAWLRLVWIHFAMRYDEAYTYVAFASQPAWKVISDYHLPNNHVFHSLLVHIATRLVGSIEPWAVRLPTFLAGVLVIPTVYFLARRLYGRPPAVIAACLVAGVDYLVKYSADARGYMLMTLLTLLAFWAGTYVLQHKNRLVWMGLAALCALGFFTVPIMLYPFGGLMVWLLASALAGDLGPGYRSRWDFLRYWTAAGAAAALLTLLLYTPILVFSGPKSLVANQFVSTLPWDQFLVRMRTGWRGTWIEWMGQVSAALQVALAAGFGASLLLHRRASRYKIPTQIPMIAWIALVLLAQRSDTFSKLWVFLEALFLIWAGAGLAALTGLIENPRAAALPHTQAGRRAGSGPGMPLPAARSLYPAAAAQPRSKRHADHHGAPRSGASAGRHDRRRYPGGCADPVLRHGRRDPAVLFLPAEAGDRPFKRAFLIVAPKFQTDPGLSPGAADPETSSLRPGCQPHGERFRGLPGLPRPPSSNGPVSRMKSSAHKTVGRHGGWAAVLVLLAAGLAWQFSGCQCRSSWRHSGRGAGTNPAGRGRPASPRTEPGGGPVHAARNPRATPSRAEYSSAFSRAGNRNPRQPGGGDPSTNRRDPTRRSTRTTAV